MNNNSRLVYSSDGGRETAAQTEAPRRKKPSKRAKSLSAPVVNDGIVRIHRSSKGRKGKGVCLVAGVPLAGPELKALAKVLKQLCGTGGAVKDGVIEIQGDQRDRLKAELEKLGYTVKLAGG